VTQYSRSKVASSFLMRTVCKELQESKGWPLMWDSKRGKKKAPRGRGGKFRGGETRERKGGGDADVKVWGHYRVD